MLEVCCAAQGSYVRHSAAMLHSVLEHAPPGGARVHYLHGPRFPAADARKLGAMVEALGGRMHFVAVDPAQLRDLPDPHEFTQAMWYRLLLPDLIPDADRVLYLDVDTLAADELAPLWATELGDHSVGAVTNVFERRFAHRPEELGLAGPQAYFNSGVLLMNLAAMRDRGAAAALRAYARERGPDLLWPDQDALNVVLGATRLALHPRWNVMNSTIGFDWAPAAYPPGQVQEARVRPGIRHFEGPVMNKPWHLLCDWPHRELYRHHRRQTPWPRVRPAGLSAHNLWLRARGRTGVSA